MENQTRRKFLSVAGTGLGIGTFYKEAAGWAGSGGLAAESSSDSNHQIPGSGAVADPRREKDNFKFARFLNSRTDNELVATFGTCYENDFRFFTMLRHESWDYMHWDSLGNAAQMHRSWYHWPYEQRLSIKVNDADISGDLAQVDQVEQQFDFRQVWISSPFVNIDRLDMMVSGRQWITALRITNRLASPARIVAECEWTTQNKEPINLRTLSDHDNKVFAYSVPSGPTVLVRTNPQGTWRQRDDRTVRNRWDVTLEAGESTSLTLNVHIGWATVPESESATIKDGVPGIHASDEKTAIDQHTDWEGFRKLTTALGVKIIGEQWEDLQAICEARRKYLYDHMPRLQGFAPQWAGMWSYIFDLIRSGVYPAQGNFKDVWMVADLIVYREPFVWDGPGAVHTFCNFDANLAARTLRTFLLAATQVDGALPVSANPYRPYPNSVPQLANNTMALWDCYQVTQDKAILTDCYPVLVRHVRWLETKRNRTPDGPLMDVGWNIDYGPPELYNTPTIWPDVQFFLVDHYRKLAQIAKAIGKMEPEQNEWTDKANRLAKAIREHMWDEKSGTFWCVSDQLEFKQIASPIEFHGMVTGVASRAQSRLLLARLKDRTKYAPSGKYPYGLPSAPFDSPLFVIKDSWSGSVWPIQTYYTVRGLAQYGYQDEAAALASNLYGMMARWYRETGTIWEQYDPRSGMDLNTVGAAGSGNPDIGRGYFISGIATSVGDVLLRGVFGFERTDLPFTFYLTPRPLRADWHGIENLQLSGNTRLSIQIKAKDKAIACKVKFSGLKNGVHAVAIHRVDLENGSKRLIWSGNLNDGKEIAVDLEKSAETRYLWEARSIGPSKVSPEHVLTREKPA